MVRAVTEPAVRALYGHIGRRGPKLPKNSTCDPVSSVTVQRVGVTTEEGNNASLTLSLTKFSLEPLALESNRLLVSCSISGTVVLHFWY